MEMPTILLKNKIFRWNHWELIFEKGSLSTVAFRSIALIYFMDLYRAKNGRRSTHWKKKTLCISKLAWSHHGETARRWFNHFGKLSAMICIIFHSNYSKIGKGENWIISRNERESKINFFISFDVQSWTERLEYLLGANRGTQDLKLVIEEPATVYSYLEYRWL